MIASASAVATPGPHWELTEGAQEQGVAVQVISA